MCGIASFVMAANSRGEIATVNIFGTADAYVGNNDTGSNNEIYFDVNCGDDSITVADGYV